MIRDKFALGSLAGVCGAIPQTTFLFLAYPLHWIQYSPFQISGIIFVEASQIHTFFGIIFGILTWLFASAILGVLTALVLEWQGTDFWWLKGLLVNMGVMSLYIYGFLFDVGAEKNLPFNAVSNLTLFTANIIFSLTVAYLVVRWRGSSENIR